MLANDFFIVADDIGGTGSTDLTLDISTITTQISQVYTTHTHTHKKKKKMIFFFFIFKRQFFINQASFKEITSSSAFTEDFGNQMVFHVNVGICVIAPPLTAGLQERFTVAAMASHILLL